MTPAAILYPGIAMFFLTLGVMLWLAVGLAWAFFATRCVHSFIHLGSNNVSVRFFTFGTSLVFLMGIWVSLLVALLTRGAQA